MKIIDKINERCNEHNINESVDLSLNLFDKSYMNALHKIYAEKAYDCQSDEVISSCKVRFDDEGNAYLNFVTNYGKDIFVISTDLKYQGLRFALVVPEGFLMNSSFREFLDLKETEYRREFVTSSFARHEFKDVMKNSCDKIMKYLAAYIMDKNFDIISFYSTVDNSDGVSSYNGGVSSGRKNELLDFDIRCEVLENNKYAYKIEAYDLNKDVDSNYVVYCYNLPDKKTRFIAEPISGCKYTKIAYFDNLDLTLEKAKDVSKDMLEYSQNDISNIGNITRHRHLELEQYKKLIQYVLNGSGDISFGMKKSIDNASNYEDNKFVRKK